MTDGTKTFIQRNHTKLKKMFDEYIDERTKRLFSMPAGEERDKEIEFIKAFKEWQLVLSQFDGKSAASIEKAI